MDQLTLPSPTCGGHALETGADRRGRETYRQRPPGADRQGSEGADRQRETYRGIQRRKAADRQQQTDKAHQMQHITIIERTSVHEGY